MTPYVNAPRKMKKAASQFVAGNYDDAGYGTDRDQEAEPHLGGRVNQFQGFSHCYAGINKARCRLRAPVLKRDGDYSENSCGKEHSARRGGPALPGRCSGHIPPGARPGWSE